MWNETKTWNYEVIIIRAGYGSDAGATRYTQPAPDWQTLLTNSRFYTQRNEQFLKIDASLWTRAVFCGKWTKYNLKKVDGMFPVTIKYKRNGSISLINKKKII